MKTDADIIVLGAGAAGLSAAQYGSRANLKTLVIEETAPGGQALLIDALENYPGFPEPLNGYDFTEKLKAQAEKFGAEFMTATAHSIRREKRVFYVDTSEGSRSCLAVILATGSKHRTLGVPGETEFTGRGVSYCATCDGPFFRGKRMIVVGGGDAACDEAMFLSKLADSIIMTHRRDRFRAQKALADRTLKNPKIDVRFDTVVDEIRGDKKTDGAVLRNLKTGKTAFEPAAAVFVFIGSDPRAQLVPDAKKDEGGSVVTDQEMATSLPGIFAAGDVRSTPFRQLVVAAGEGAIAAHSAARFIDELKGEGY
jgi:thioredoxin reductase (NADPH)